MSHLIETFDQGEIKKCRSLKPKPVFRRRLSMCGKFSNKSFTLDLLPRHPSLPIVFFCAGLKKNLKKLITLFNQWPSRWIRRWWLNDHTSLKKCLAALPFLFQVWQYYFFILSQQGRCLVLAALASSATIFQSYVFFGDVLLDNSINWAYKFASFFFFFLFFVAPHSLLDAMLGWT